MAEDKNERGKLAVEAFRRLRSDNHKLKVILGYIVKVQASPSAQEKQSQLGGETEAELLLAFMEEKLHRVEQADQHWPIGIIWSSLLTWLW